MGRGNCCTYGDLETLYYIDSDYYASYYNEAEDNWASLGDLSLEDISSGLWKFAEGQTRVECDDLIEEIVDGFCRRFRSFRDRRDSKVSWLNGCVDLMYEKRDCWIVAANGLFAIAIEDNEWSMAVELLQLADPYGNLENLQAGHFQHYADGLKEVLLDIVDQIGTYKGAWTSGTLTRSEYYGIAE